jgi:uncharacterized protein (DUF305 family)
MRPSASRHAFALLLAAVGSPACSGASRSVETTPQPSATSSAELEAIYRARLDSARNKYTAADVRFMSGMIGHHAQALAMAGLAQRNGAGPAILVLTGRILNAQKDEIALMQQWLRERGQPVPQVHVAGATLMAPGHEHILHMPGMLTEEQMGELDRARGREFDRLFLTFMIQHHRGAVTMVHELFAIDGAALDDVVFKLASDIQVDQTTEIARMELMLAELGRQGEGEPAGETRSP